MPGGGLPSFSNSSEQGSILRYVLNKLEIIKNTGREFYPVVDLGIYGEINQFSDGDGANAWDMFFEPVSEFSVEDVYNSKNVLLAYDGMKTKNPYLYEQDKKSWP